MIALFIIGFLFIFIVCFFTWVWVRITGGVSKKITVPILALVVASLLALLFLKE